MNKEENEDVCVFDSLSSSDKRRAQDLMSAWEDCSDDVEYDLPVWAYVAALLFFAAFIVFAFMMINGWWLL